MRAEVGTESVPDAAGWSRIVFIAAVCALGGLGFLGATVVMNGRALSFQRSSAAPLPEAPVPAPTPEPVAQAPSKPKPPVNDRFQPVDFAPRPGVNKATLARCRSHVEAGRPFESLSLKRIAEMRDTKTNLDPEAICADYLAAEARHIPGVDQLRR
jgi:hypothetical protein